MKRVLFVCIGNSCRSQMAEWFARTYGMDVMKPESAGLQPAGVVSEMTKLVMLDKGITMVDPIPKGIAEFNPDNIDLIVNISGFGLPKMYRSKDIVTWAVEDPIGKKQVVYEKVRDQLEGLVMRLILDLRTAGGPPRKNRPLVNRG
jgi:arsenate reductase (thioredoxin)